MICKSRDPENNNSGEEGAEVEFSGSNPMRWQTERKRKHKKLIHITKFTLCSKTDGTFFIFIHSHTYILLVCTLCVLHNTCDSAGDLGNFDGVFQSTESKKHHKSKDINRMERNWWHM